jgi:hypothetical protein
VRLEVGNGDLALRPEMFVDVALHADLGERVVVPASAVIVAGSAGWCSSTAARAARAAHRVTTARE